MHAQVFKYLLKKADARVNAVDKSGVPMFQVALNNVQKCPPNKHEEAKEIFKALIRVGVDTTIGGTFVHPNSTVTCKTGSQIDYCRRFIKSTWHDSEIHTAVYNDDFEFFKDFDTPMDVNCRGKGGWTPLHVACMFNRGLIAKALIIIFKADIFAKTDKGETALMIAVMRGNLELILTILRAMELVKTNASHISDPS